MNNVVAVDGVVVVVVGSVPGDSSGAVQAGAGRSHLGAEAHDAARRRHRPQHSLSAAAERRAGGQCRAELLPDVLHRHTPASLLRRHRQLTHCRSLLPCSACATPCPTQG